MAGEKWFTRQRSEELACATAAVEAAKDITGDPLLYARVDIARDLSNAPVLMELELIEPYHYPRAGAWVRRAVRRRIPKLHWTSRLADRFAHLVQLYLSGVVGVLQRHRQAFAIGRHDARTTALRRSLRG